MSTTMPLHWIIFLSTFFTINSSLLGRPYSTLLHDYTINEKGRINLIKETKDSFDRLILVIGKRSNIYYQKQKGTILNRHILLKKASYSIQYHSKDEPMDSILKDCKSPLEKILKEQNAYLNS